MSGAAEIAVAEEDRLRADLYDFLAALLARPPDGALLARTADLTGDETELGQAIGALSRLAQRTEARRVAREYQDLFIGLGRGELLPYASYYLTGFLNERPLATLRGDMARRGIVRSGAVSEPEDHIAALCEMMAGQITGRFGRAASLAEQREFFDRHIAPWAPHFFADLEAARTSVFYAPVGTVGRIFTQIEREAFRLAAEAPA